MYEATYCTSLPLVTMHLIIVGCKIEHHKNYLCGVRIIIIFELKGLWLEFKAMIVAEKFLKISEN